MQAVRIALEAEHWLSALEDVTTRAGAQGREQVVVLRIDPHKQTLTLRDEEGDSVYKITLPLEMVAEGEVIDCRVQPSKLEPMLPVLQSGQGGILLSCRSTTLTFQIGKKSFVIPNRIIERKAEGEDLFSLFKGAFDGEQMVRFQVEDVEHLRQAVQACPDSVVRVRVGNGVVQVQEASFATESRRAGSFLWPREVLVRRLMQMPDGLPLQVTAMENRAVYVATTGQLVRREVVLKQIPATTLYMTKPQVASKSMPSDHFLWSNQMLLPEKERKRQPRGLGVKEEPRGGFLLDDLLGDAPEEESGPYALPPQLEISEPEPEPESPGDGSDRESALQKLQRLPGLLQVKRQIREIAQYACFEKERLQVLGTAGSIPTLHMSFLGNPGTGKTMVARMIGEIFHELGLISRGHVVEVDRQLLVGAYMGHTEANLAKYVKRALGGILFIDEAYSLYKKDSSKDFGLTAINGLVKVMEDYRENLIVIVAGYRKEMNEFFSFNPGLRERIPFHIEFPDYSAQELAEVATYLAGQDHYVLTDEARELLVQRALREKIDETFGNARTVRNLLDKAKIHHAVRLSAVAGETSEASYTTLTADDFADGEPAEHESLEQVLAELDRMVGLGEVKTLVRQMVNVLELEKRRLECGLENEPLTLHMAFTGNPGTGKTTVARLMGRLLRAMNLLPRGHYVEASRKDLIAGYMGQTTLKTAEKMKEALGGVLFIDEAYALVRKGREDFGAEALATLIKEMEDKKELLTVVLAGYTKQMEGLFAANPGLKSRVRFHLHFPDYTASELVEIVKRKAEAANYVLTAEAEERLWTYFLRACLEAGDDFGNGRLAENVFEQAKIRLSTRLSQMQGDVGREQLMTITEADLEV